MDYQYNLDWITEADLTRCCMNLFNRAKKAGTALRMDNVLDPFSALFDMEINGLDPDSWKQNEINRQRQKTLQNAVGDFHQDVIGCIEGWENKKVGNVVDLVNDEFKVYCELKNKYNTLKGSDRDKVYDIMADARGRAGKYEGYTCYLVEILTKSRFDRPFTPSSNKTGIQKPAVEKIREIDGSTFLSKFTGSPTALRDLYEALPYIFKKINPASKAEEFRKSPFFRKLIDQALHE